MLTTAFAVPTNSDNSLKVLGRFIRKTPSLKRVDIGHNHFLDLPASLVNTIISYPRLRNLCLAENQLERTLSRSTPCATNHLLSQWFTAAFSSLPALRDLDLTGCGMSTECCGSVLEKVLALGSSGLRSLCFSGNPSLISHGRTLSRIISNHNFTIEQCYIDGLCRFSRGQNEFYDNKDSQLLKSTLERNRRSNQQMQEAACGVLKVDRIVLMGAPGPLRSSPVLAKHFVYFRLLDLPLSWCNWSYRSSIQALYWTASSCL